MLDMSATVLSFQHKKTKQQREKENTYTMYNDMQDGKKKSKGNKKQTNKQTRTLNYRIEMMV
jgi:hypothetical protein